MNFSENELLRKDHTSSFLAYGEEGNHVLEFQTNFSEDFEELSSNDGSNVNQIELHVFQPSHLHSTELHVDQPLRDQLPKTAFRSSEQP